MGKQLILFGLIVAQLASCRPQEQGGSEVYELENYKQSMRFHSRPSDADPTLVLRGDFGTNDADGRRHRGRAQPGNLVFGPHKSILATHGSMRASAKIKADFYRPYIIPVGTLCIDCPMEVPARGSFVVDFVYRKDGQDFATPTVVASREISLSGWNPEQNIEIGSTELQGNLNHVEVRVHSIRAEEFADIKVYSTNIDVSWNRD